MAVNTVISAYDTLIAARGLAVEGESGQYPVREQRALAEALVRMWALCGLPSLLAQFEVLQVEQELLYPFTEDIVLMSRPDAILRERATSDLYVLSFKTAAHFDKRKDKECQHDDQGISEVVAVEHALGERVMGVRYEFLLKGSRSEYPRGSGRWVQWSPLLRAYTKDGQYAANYEWTDAESGLKRRLGRGWERIDVWESFDGGIAAWIEWLAANDRATLESQLVVPMPYYRNGAELESWVRQRSWQEEKVSAYASLVEAQRVHGKNFETWLDNEFPQNRRSCDYPGSCQFLDICFGPVPARDPLSSGEYIRRTPHHMPELQQLAAIASINKGGPNERNTGVDGDASPATGDCEQGDHGSESA